MVESMEIRYTIRVHHRNDNHWGASPMKMFKNKSDALTTAKWMNQEWGKNWVYAVFEYHGRRDYRIVDPAKKTP